MKTFEVILSKSYTLKIKAKNKKLAKEFSQFYTGDVFDISTEKERIEKKFEIKNIDCKLNEVFEVKEINEDN